MKAILIDGVIREFNVLPNEWKNHLNFNQATPELAQSEGFYDLVEPQYNPTLQRLGDIFFDAQNGVFTYALIAKTQQQVAQEAESQQAFQDQQSENTILKRLLITISDILLKTTNITPSQLYDLSLVQPVFAIGITYTTGDSFMYNSVLYEVLINHTSMPGEIPSELAGIYTPKY